MTHRSLRLGAAALLVAVAACAPPSVAPPIPGPGGAAPALPPIPRRDGPLRIDVVYPSEGATVATDSTFLFGGVGTGAARLAVNGAAVPVAPNGAWLAFLPVPGDGVYRVEATAAGRTERATRTVRVPSARLPRPALSPFEAGVTPVASDTAAPSAPLRVAVAASARADRTVIGTAVPGEDTPYHWFFPNGTRLNIASERDGELRVRLTDDLSVWVDADEVRLLPPGTAPVEGAVGAVRLVPAPGYVDVRLGTSERLPFRVDGSEDGLEITVYGAKSRTNWLYYGAQDPLVRRVAWEQPRDDEYRLRLELAEPLWGWTSFYDADGTLVVRVRRPPRIDPEDPLRGVRVAVDAGHPPGGAIGPTRLAEAEANLAIARRLVALLRERGAEVVEIRPDTTAVALGDRPLLAERAGADLLVSVHNNAFPDGVNPFENNGTSVFYNAPQSLGLARALQRELLAEFGLRDLGIARADLALVRPTSLPSALTETMFLMIPEQEAALRDPEVWDRIARAHQRGIEAFLRERATDAP